MPEQKEEEKSKFESKNFQAGNVITISAAHLIHDIFSSFLAPLLPLLITKFNLTYSFASLLTVVQRVPSLLNPLIGLAADKLPVKYILIAAPSITSVGMSLLGLMPDYFSLMLLLLFTGFGVSMFHIPAPVVIKNISGNRIGKGMSFFMLGGELARGLGPVLILGAVSIWGFEGTFRLMPAGLLASFLLFIRLRKLNIYDKVKETDVVPNIKAAISTALPSFITITGIQFFNSIIKTAFTAFLPTFMTVHGESLWIGGISLSVLQLAGAAGTFSSGTISDRIGRRKTLVSASIIIPILSVVFLYSGSILKFPILLLLGFFLFAATPVTLAEINDLKSGRPAFINSIYMSINFLTAAFSVMMVGILGDFLGLESTFLICGLTSTCGIFFAFRLSNKK